MDDLLADELRTENKGTEQAQEMWRQLIEEGDEDARAEYADYLFRRRWDDEEERSLEAELAEGRVSWLNWLRAAVLLEKRGQLVDALIMYTRVTVDVTAEQVSTSRWTKLMMTGRRRVKWALGMELDSLDLLGDAGYVEQVDRYFDLLDLLRHPVVFRGRAQVWSRAELAVAREHWPGRITVESIDAYYRNVESVLRRYDEPVTVMHRTFDFLMEHVDSLKRVLAGPSQSERPPGAPESPGVPWPPERNQPCWCDSGRKYKRCCGMGGLLADPEQAWGPTGLRSGAQLAVCKV
jgi:hypothetical protein